MECLGGVGYVDENVISRLYREAPVNSIWEGSGNVQCLDLLRVLHKEPHTLDVLLAEFELARGKHPLLDQHLDKLRPLFSDSQTVEVRARQIMESLALAWQASTLYIYGEELIARAFVESRLSSATYHQYGTIPATIDCKAIIERALAHQ